MAKLVNVFQNIQKADVVDIINREVNFSYQYFALLILSVVIATFGLLLGNTAIIIGAMILSPMIWPVIGMSIGTVTSKKRLTLRSFILLSISIVISVLIAYSISVLSPITEVNSEIALRVNPTFFDLIIALAAGTAAILIISWPKYSNYLAGVAVAASILPPICVTGIGLALGAGQVAYGSFILFLTNTASIIFVGIGIFALLGFYRKNDENQVRKVELGLIISFVVVLLLSFQLIFSLSQILYEENAEIQIESTLNEELSNISSDIAVESVKVTALSRNSDTIGIDAVVRVPSDVSITVTQKNEIVELLATLMEKEINLELRIVPVLRVINDEDVDSSALKKDNAGSVAQEVVADRVSAISPEIIVDSVAVSVKSDNSIERYSVDVQLRLPSNVSISTADKESIIFELVRQLERPVILNIDAVRYEKI